MWSRLRRFFKGPFPLPVRRRPYPYAFGPPYPKVISRPNGFGGPYVNSVREERRERDFYETVPMYPDEGWEEYEGYLTDMYGAFHLEAQRLFDQTRFEPIADTPRIRAIRKGVERAFSADGDAAHYSDSDELDELASSYGGYNHYIGRLAHAFVFHGLAPEWPADEFESALGSLIDRLAAYEAQHPESDAWWWREDAESLRSDAIKLRDAALEARDTGIEGASNE